MRRRASTSRWRLEDERAKHDHSHRAGRSRRRGPRIEAGSQRSRDRRGERMSTVTEASDAVGRQRLAAEIRALAAERNAVILAHNYQRGEVQDVADYVGDSLGLARQAAATDADVILFAGV